MSSNLNPAQQEKALKLELRLAQIAKNEGCQLNFLDFVRCFDQGSQDALKDINVYGSFLQIWMVY